MVTTFSISIKASPEKVFPFVGDLLRHPEWATDKMKMEIISLGSPKVGSKYRSTTNFKGMLIVADLQVIEYQPPCCFAFTVNDKTGSYFHKFVLYSQGDGTLLERITSSEKKDWDSKFLTMILMPILIAPESKQALRLLKARAEC